jgi:hypothetical protein
VAQELTPEMLKVIDRIQKLLNLAAKNPNKEEAEAAAAKAQDLLTQYNLDAAIVERTQGIKDGAREELKMRGGFYKWQADIWSAVAELNFCLYWTQDYFVPQKPRHIAEGRSSQRRQKRHRLIGRIVNTTATKVMAQYLEQAIEKSVRDTLNITHKEQFSNYANSFRKGAAEELIDKIGKRYRERLKDDRAKAAMAKAAAGKAEAQASGASSSMALTLSDYVQSEEDANQDFMHGEGYSAKRRAREAEYAREQAEREAAQTAWAKANPEEAAKQEAERRAENEAYWRKHRSRGGSGPRDKTDYGAYSRGREAGKKISIDPQMGGGAAKMIGSKK